VQGALDHVDLAVLLADPEGPFGRRQPWAGQPDASSGGSMPGLSPSQRFQRPERSG
jgi:hypothetical protein